MATMGATAWPLMGPAGFTSPPTKGFMSSRPMESTCDDSHPPSSNLACVLRTQQKDTLRSDDGSCRSERERVDNSGRRTQHRDDHLQNRYGGGRIQGSP